MRYAYKGFNKDLTCTMGKGTFQYEPRVWYREDKAHCAKDGFHATDNPLDVLDYYRNGRYFIVELSGNIDEDGYNTRISAPEIRLIKEITKLELIREGVMWLVNHPDMKSDSVVRNKGTASDGYVIVRGRSPVAAGGKGDTVFLIKEDKSGEITECAEYPIDGKKYLPDTYYDVKGRKVR